MNEDPTNVARGVLFSLCAGLTLWAIIITVIIKLCQS